MKKIVFVLALLSISAIASEKSHFGYVALQPMMALPICGVGYHAQEGKHALDVSGGMCPIPEWFPTSHARALYLWYPKEHGFYMGGGAGYYYLNWDRSTKGPTFEGTIGYQGGDNHPLIFGLNAMNPIGTKVLLPGLSVGYGF